ncbi:hypothetical protein ACF06X_27825 [Streptomyces sp. NPDC015346]|uniref:hypothetical protein n=1 Tax=Streptomyces sp. NPDC015346 TaxID=3364954 RepID=UPI0036FE356E
MDAAGVGLVSATAAVVGAALGAAGAIAAAVTLARSENRESRRQARREAYLAFLDAAEDATQELAHVTRLLALGRSNYPAIHEQVSGVPRALRRHVSVVLIEGPEEAAQAAQRFSTAVRAWQAVLSEHQHMEDTEWAWSADLAATAASEALAEFRGTARAALHGPDRSS